MTLANWVYIYGHWPVIIMTLAWLFVRAPAEYLLRNAMFISGAIGLVIFVLFPVAPPRLGVLEIVDTVTQRSNSYRTLQPPGLINRYAAMPSLHFGWNLLVGDHGLARVAPAGGCAPCAVVMVAAMGLAVVVTANHYVVDVAGRRRRRADRPGLALLLPRVRRTPGVGPAPRVSVPGVLVGPPRGERPGHAARPPRGAPTWSEADVHLFRGRLEVRHAKTLGPLPILWEKWYLLDRDAPRPLLGDLLPLVPPVVRPDARPQGARPAPCPGRARRERRVRRPSAGCVSAGSGRPSTGCGAPRACGRSTRWAARASCAGSRMVAEGLLEEATPCI